MKMIYGEKTVDSFGRKLVACSLCAVGAILLLCGCDASSTRADVDGDRRSASAVAQRGFSSSGMIQRSSPLLPGFSLRELAERAELIVRGQVVSISDSFLVKPVDDAEPKFFENVYVRVDEVLAGAPSYADGQDEEAATIAVRTEGGAGELIATVNDGTPDFSEGQEYLLFLYQYDDGSYYNTEGNHYFIVGVEGGAWQERDGIYFPPFSHPDDPGSFSVDDVREVLAAMPMTLGIDKVNTATNGDLDRIRKDYEADAISEEAYRAYLDQAHREATQFAQVMTKEEQLAYERERTESLRSAG